jgi:hypothetical protein
MAAAGKTSVFKRGSAAKGAVRLGGAFRLLQRAIEIVFAGANAIRQRRNEIGGRFLAMRAYQGRKGCEERCVGESLAFDAIVLRRVPGFGKIFERQLALFGLAFNESFDLGWRENRFCSGSLPFGLAWSFRPSGREVT